MADKKRSALGKGLGALLENPQTDITDENIVAGSVTELKLENIEVNPFQPRTEFDEETLRELTQSIKELGVIQPVTVRKIGYGKYQLISGERRFRAAQKAGLTTIPAFIRIANDQAMLELALVENIQRQDLDPIEIAYSYERLIEECNLTQEKLSERIGVKRATIANYLRLLNLPPEIQLGIRAKQITMGHAKALINIEDNDTKIEIFYDIVENEFSVRQTEAIAKDFKTKKITKRKNTAAQTTLPEQFEIVQNKLQNYFDSPIKLKRNANGKGTIVIPFKSEDDMKSIIKKINNSFSWE